MNSVHNFSSWLRFIIILGFITSSLILIVLYTALKPTPADSSVSANNIIYTSPSRENITVSTSTKPAIETSESISPEIEAQDKIIEPNQEPKVDIKPLTTTPDTYRTSVVNPVQAIEKTKLLVPTSPDSTFSISEMLDGHNQARLKKNILPLTWSNALAKDAQAWSEVLKNESCRMRHDLSSIHGENIFWQKQSGGDISSMISRPSDANDWWINEENFYNYKKNACQPGEQCGHYTQIVWDNTSTIGCGVSSCLDDKERIDIWVCRYDPPGNDGGRPY